MRVVFDGELRVHYGFVLIEPSDGSVAWELLDARRGQNNGLCGAQVPGALSMITGLHTGRVGFRIEELESAPPLADGWDDVVEVSFVPTSADLQLSTFDTCHPVTLDLLPGRAHRARYGCANAEAARHADTLAEDEAVIDTYLLQLWPEPAHREDVVIRETNWARYWHNEAQSQQ